MHRSNADMFSAIEQHELSRRLPPPLPIGVLHPPPLPPKHPSGKHTEPTFTKYKESVEILTLKEEDNYELYESINDSNISASSCYIRNPQLPRLYAPNELPLQHHRTDLGFRSLSPQSEQVSREPRQSILTPTAFTDANFTYSSSFSTSLSMPSKPDMSVQLCNCQCNDQYVDDNSPIWSKMKNAYQQNSSSKNWYSGSGSEPANLDTKSKCVESHSGNRPSTLSRFSRTLSRFFRRKPSNSWKNQDAIRSRSVCTSKNTKTTDMSKQCTCKQQIHCSSRASTDACRRSGRISVAATTYLATMECEAPKNVIRCSSRLLAHPPSPPLPLQVNNQRQLQMVKRHPSIDYSSVAGMEVLEGIERDSGVTKTRVHHVHHIHHVHHVHHHLHHLPEEVQRLSLELPPDYISIPVPPHPILPSSSAFTKTTIKNIYASTGRKKPVEGPPISLTYAAYGVRGGQAPSTTATTSCCPTSTSVVGSTSNASASNTTTATPLLHRQMSSPSSSAICSHSHCHLVSSQGSESMRPPSNSEIAVAEAGAAAAAVVLSSPPSEMLPSSTTISSDFCQDPHPGTSSSTLRPPSFDTSKTFPQSVTKVNTSGKFMHRQVQHHLHHHHHVHHMAPSTSPSPNNNLATGIPGRLRVSRPPSGPLPHVCQSPPLVMAPRAESAAPCIANMTTSNMTTPSPSRSTTTATTTTTTVNSATTVDHRSSFQQSMNTLRKMGWYWGPLSFTDAEQLLASRPDGTFLVRDSGHETFFLSLSFRVRGTTYHTRIEHNQGRFSFWFQPESHSAKTVVEFIEEAVAYSIGGKFHYFLQTDTPGQQPVEVPLLYPLSRFQMTQSLKHLSRFTILSHVRRDHVARLSLPPGLIGYLLEKQVYWESLEEFEEAIRNRPPLRFVPSEPSHRSMQSLLPLSQPTAAAALEEPT